MPITIPSLISYCEIRINYLKTLKNSYAQLGELEKISQIDAEITEVESTINSLKSLL